jgi:2-oxoglutarate dehydrogenase E2 component (dihydrolipoamide succinyltransferase)
MVNIVVPELGESVTEATIGKWYKKSGDKVESDEIIVELETDKVTLEVNAPQDGVISSVNYEEGDTVEVGQILGEIGESDSAAATSQASEGPSKQESSAPEPESSATKSDETPKPAAETASSGGATDKATASSGGGASGVTSPAAEKILAEKGIDSSSVQGTGKDGRITKEDAQNTKETAEPNNSEIAASQAGSSESSNASETESTEKPVEVVRMSRLRKKIAERLKHSQDTAAMLSTFNEVDMSYITEIRHKHKESFKEKHGVKLGVMSFFVKAAVKALKEVPAINSEIDGDHIVYKHYYDIGVAVGTDQGLVVPVLRQADKLSFAEIEKQIAELGGRAREGKLTMEELSGGSFTITNGGVYGSLLSTPIINPPQSGILGMHKMQERPVAVGGEVKIRPMMYTAMSYDHRVVDGKEAVTFLVKLKEAIENPELMLVD